MSERINTPFTNEHFADWCQKMVGQPYWYGTCVYKATNSLLSRKSNQYPSSYASSRMSRYKQDIANKAVVSDCIGGCKGYAWTNGGQGVLEAIGTDKTITSKYGSNGCPDKGANSMFSWAKKKGADWGTIDTLPEIPGLALYKDGHAGYYIGNGYAVEWQGFSWGCVKTQVKKRPWTHWYKLPFIDYGDTSGAQIAVEAVTVYMLGSRLLKNGSSGADVKALQELLNQPFILTEKGMSYRRLMDEKFAELSMEILPVLEIGSAGLICSLVEQGAGISFLPDYVTEEKVRAGRLRYLPVKNFEIEIWKQLLYHRDKWVTPQLESALAYLSEREFR